MSQRHRIGLAVRALAKTGSVVVRRPTVLVYPFLMALSVGLLIPALAAPVVLIEGTSTWVVWLLSVTTYFLGGGVLCTALFGAMMYEIDGVFRGQRQFPFAGLRAVWHRRRPLTALGLVLGSGGMVGWFARPLLERVLGETPIELLSALQGAGNMYAILIVMLEDVQTGETVEQAVRAVSETALESIVTTEVIQGVSTVCLVSGAAFGIGATLTGFRVAPLGFFTPFLGFLLVPALTVFLCCLLEGVARTAIYRHATGERTESTGPSPNRLLRPRRAGATE